jgi:two-component system CheB/CheR fusion protein
MARFSVGEVGDRLRMLREAQENTSFVWEQTAPGNKRFSLSGHALRVLGQPAYAISIEDVTRARHLQQQTARRAADLEGEGKSKEAQLAKAQKELQRLTSHLLNAQEDERKRIARELHDDVGQRLSLLALKLHGLRQNGRAEGLEALAGDLDEINSAVRETSHRLHPMVLDQLGLQVAVKALVDEFGRAESMPTTFTSANLPPEIDESASNAAYRIAQEALHNISKHAGRTHVKVSLRGAQGSRVLLEVQDNGFGFDEGAPPAGGLGLINMKERARLAGGSLTIQSRLGEGTTVRAELPVARG